MIISPKANEIVNVSSDANIYKVLIIISKKINSYYIMSRLN